MKKQTVMELMGFGDDHVPLMKVAKSQKHQQIPVTFPTRKGAQKSIRARSKLMRDALVHFETNPEVERISAYPIRLEYQVSDRYGVAGSLNHIPMLGVWSRQQQASYFDILPLSFQEENRWIELRTRKLREVFWEDYRATYAVLDERNLHIQPRMMNLDTMRYHAYRYDNVAVMQVRRALSTLPPRTTIQAITDAAALPDRAHVFYDEDGTVAQFRPLTDVKRAFSAVMWLAVQGEVKVDISVPISFLSSVSKISREVSIQERVA